MPKLARDNNYYYSQYNNSQIYDYRTYANRRDMYYRGLQEAKTPIKPKRKKTPVQIFISMLFLCFVFFCAMPFAFRNVTKAIFVPTPYKKVKVDMYSAAFPTTDYISNTWFMGHRGFGYSLEGKDAQMMPIKENVNMPVLKQKLLELGTLFPTIKPSVYVWDYETGNYVDINANKSYSAASIIKIPVLLELFKSIFEINYYSI